MIFLKVANVLLFLCFVGLRTLLILLTLNWFIFEPFMNTSIGPIHAFGFYMAKIILDWKDTSELKRRTPVQQFDEVMTDITIGLIFLVILFGLKYFL